MRTVVRHQEFERILGVIGNLNEQHAARPQHACGRIQQSMRRDQVFEDVAQCYEVELAGHVSQGARVQALHSRKRFDLQPVFVAEFGTRQTPTG